MQPFHQASWFRVTVASDDREVKQVRVALAQSEQTLGTLDIRYGVVLQPFDLPLTAEQSAAAMTQGVQLTLNQGTTPLWLFHDPESRGPGHDALLPHLRPVTHPSPAEKRAAFLKRFTSLASLQQFGWMEGCVLEGLEALSRLTTDPTLAARAADARRAHLALFFPDGRMVYECPRGTVADDSFRTIEATLMVAAVARHLPDHPALDLALRFWDSRCQEAGAVGEGETVTAEGSLTIAYPAAVLARLRDDRRLAELAITQLRVRQQRLRDPDGLYLRHNAPTDTRTYRNWSRGVAWHLLGLVKTIVELDGWLDPDLLAPLKRDCAALCPWVMRFQGPEGLWFCYLHARETGVETSGSAGIAAALALAHAHDLAPAGAQAAALRAHDALLAHLTNDGMLHGVSQSNKGEGGEALQRSGYRTLSQTGMGLLAHLIAALDDSLACPGEA